MFLQYAMQSVDFMRFFFSSVYPYTYNTSLKKLRETTSFPPLSAFWDDLREEFISEKDWQWGKYTWDLFNCKTLEEYNQLYCQIDTLGTVFYRLHALRL